MLRIPIIFNDQEAMLHVLTTRFGIAEGTALQYYDFVLVKSVHVKNTEAFLMKIRLESSALIFKFHSMHVRDLVKAILLNKVVSPENMQSDFLEKNMEARAMFNCIKSLAKLQNKEQSNDTIKSQLLNNRRISMGYGLYNQKGISDVYSQDFVSALTQPLVEIFLSMNCSFNQFFNLMITTNFNDIKNPKTSIDRLINEKLRGFSGEIDCASRINSYSLLALEELTTAKGDIKYVKRKPVEFEPAYPFEHIVKKSKVINIGNSYVLRLKPLECQFVAGIKGKQPVLDPWKMPLYSVLG